MKFFIVDFIFLNNFSFTEFFFQCVFLKFVWFSCPVKPTLLQDVGNQPTLMLNSFQAYTQSQEVQNYLKQSAASQGQQKQYLQAVNPVSTVSPLQSKYINSPQYLAQNYNTIPSTYLLPKAAYSGVKATPAPSAKIATQGGFVPLNPLSSASTNYQNYRSISGWDDCTFLD